MKHEPAIFEEPDPEAEAAAGGKGSPFDLGSGVLPFCEKGLPRTKAPAASRQPPGGIHPAQAPGFQKM